MGVPMQDKLGSVPPRSTEIDRKGPFSMEVTWKVLRAQLYCHVQRIRVIHEAETVPSHGSSLWPLAEIPLSEDSNYSSQGSQCQCRFVFDTRSITSQVIKRMVLYPSLFHIVTSQEICTERPPSYRSRDYP